MTIKEVSEYFDISEATVRNWLKLGKLSTAQTKPHRLILSDEVKSLSSSLETSKMLTSRRNKSRQSVNYIPKSYISATSPNIKVISSLLKKIDNMDMPILEIIDYYGQYLMKQAELPLNIINQLSLCKADSHSDLHNILSENEITYIPCEDTLGMIYISLRRLQDKKSTGSYYTPFFAVDLLLQKLKKEPKSICDPACGTGNFLLRLSDDYSLDLIHGYDIDEVAIKITRINLAIKYKIQTKEQLDILVKNIAKKDFLIDTGSYENFEYIIGNPPWGSSFSKDCIKEFKNVYECANNNGRPEAFALFVEKALKHLSQDGSMYFLLPETILASDFHFPIRQVISGSSYVTDITYLGDIFDKVQCPCIILGLSKQEKSEISTSFYSKEGKEFLHCKNDFTVPSDRIDQKSFHILATNEDYRIIDKILSTPHFTLKDKADFALGIVTGANQKLLSPASTKGFEGIVKGRDIHKYYYDEPNSFIKFEPANFQQVASEKLYRAGEKLFYRFIATTPVFAYDDKGLLSLNSANILIPHVEGYSAAYIMAILNSDVISFYYRHTFKNMKVLRSAIESLPIAKCDSEPMNRISALALSISNSKEQVADIETLNHLIRSLYGLSDDELL